jgi:hypothetical protein
MADAAGTWSAATLSTLASITQVEAEITQLVTSGTKDYSVTAADVSGAIAPTGLDVSEGKGVLEIIGIAETECVFSGFSIEIIDSADDSDYAAYGTGLTIYAKTGTVAAGTILFKYIIPSNLNDYFKPVITIGTSVGTISIYANSKLADKITIAKELIGTDLSLLLVNNNLLNYIDIETDEILDCIYNPATLSRASDFKTLELIYQDLARGATDASIAWQKKRAYKKDYDNLLAKLVQKLVIDPTQDGGSLQYYSALQFVPQAGR